MNLAAAYGLLAHGLLFGALTALLPLGQFRNRVALAATTLALVTGSAPIMLAVFGPPSVTLLALAVLQLAGHQPAPLARGPALALLGTAGCLFVSANTGLGGELYAVGYQPWPMLAALLAVGLALGWKRQTLWLLILALDLLAYAGGLFANLWSALIDPLLVLLAAFVAVRAWVLPFIASRRR